MKKLFLFILVLSLAFSCGSKRKIVTKKKDSDIEKSEEVIVTSKDETIEIKPAIPANTEEYINTYKNIALAEMQQYGIPASIILAQGILESGSGKGRLAREANNHFGIKCHGWKGDKIYHDDDELQECFRKYDRPYQSYRDHSEFLANRKRYAKLFKLKKTDYKGWARELRRAGYATDKRYPQKLISLIERYELYKFDGRDTPDSTSLSEYVVRKGDTLYSISRRYNISVEELMALNGLEDNTISIGQTLKVRN